ncbi:MAG: hypothetical protein J7L47_03895 [Candidatus Odinarchaeota archaeon]|nr:hypothetical protein [Candidatus Odinarchaeota archaeon]
MGLDKPLWEQFFIYIWNIIHLSFGRSVAISLGDPIIRFVIKRSLNTNILLFVATFVSLVAGVYLGTLTVKIKERGIAKVTLNGFQIFYSIPAFLGGSL